MGWMVEMKVGRNLRIVVGFGYGNGWVMGAYLMSFLLIVVTR